MKRLIKLPQMLSAVLLLSCTTDVQPDKQAQAPATPTIGVTQPPVTPNNLTDLLPSMYPFSDNAHFVKGQMSLIPNLSNLNTFFTTQIATPNLGEVIKVGEKLNMVAMGGGMTAGVRNGGLYRVGQMTAYPNLVARQMGIADFQSPLFAENEANGTGYLQLVDDGTAYPSWKEVRNSITTVKAGSPPELPKYAGENINNYALPGGGIIGASSSLNGLGINDYGNFWRPSQVYGSRLMPNTVDVTKVALLEQIIKQPINFFIAEDDMDYLLDAIKYNFKGLSGLGYEKYTVGPLMLSGVARIMQNSANTDKGVIFTWPIITDLAYFNWYTIQDLKNKANNITINTTRNNESYVIDGNSNNFLFLPTPTVDALFRNLKKGDNVSITLSDRDLLDPQEYNINTRFIRQYNDRIRQLAKDKGLAIVDLEKIYGQIHSNTYISSEGFKIDGATRGNFFSADGIYPTAIGQAVIANEVIKAINTTYKASIPFINLRDYSLTVGKE